MRVLAISSYGLLGGAELSMCEFLAHRPSWVDASVLMVEEGPLRARLAEADIPTWVGSGYAGAPTLARATVFTRSLLRLLARTRPDVVWATGLKAAVLAAPACRLAAVPVVWHKVDFSRDSTITLPLAAAVNGVVCVSYSVAATLGPLLNRRLLAVVGPPVRLPAELKIVPNREPLAIGTLATLTPIKGQSYMLHAAARLHDEFPDLQVVLAGAPSGDHPAYVQELHQLADRLGVSVHFTGFSHDVTETLKRLTVFVNATHRVPGGFGMEGLSGAMLEASWAGLPVVATRGGGTAEGLQDGITGTLVAPQDAGALADAIAPYLRDEHLARATGEAGRLFAREHFAPAAGAQRLFRALSRCG